MRLAPGDSFGSWTIEGLLGQGGMAAVYQVRHAELGTVRALKVLTTSSPAVEQRLKAEGRAQAALVHPHVVGVVDLLQVDGQLALLMEHVDGPDLGALLACERLELGQALELFRQIVAGVAAAHARGLIHRDLKPSNVLIAEVDGQRVARVGDFGLVKELSVDLTATHALLGTPRSMAPEQMRAARKVDARADIYSLGCLLYEMVTGEPAFSGEDLVSLYSDKVAGRWKEPRDLPAAVREALRGCLQGDPQRRIRDCAELLAVLDGASTPSGGDDRTLEERRDARLCPRCGVSGTLALCRHCGASTELDGRYLLVERLRSRIPSWRALDLLEGRWVILNEGQQDADFEEHGRRWKERVLPQRPRARVSPRDNPAVWLMGALLAQGAVVWLGLQLVAWGRTTLVGGVYEMLTTETELIPTPADLVSRPVPEGTCDETPFALRLSLVTSGVPAGSEIPILARRDCGELELVTTITVPQVGTTWVEVPGAVVLDVPWADVRCDGLECIEKRLSAPEGGSLFQELRLDGIRPLTVEVADDRGQPLEGAKVGYYDHGPNPFTVTTGPDGRASIPWGIAQLAKDPAMAAVWRVWTDSYARRVSAEPVGRDHWRLVVSSDESRLFALRAVDPEGVPVEGARVTCMAAPWRFPTYDPSRSLELATHFHHSWTDAEGWAGCELPPGFRPVRDVKVQAAGFREVHARDLRGTVALSRTRPIRLGCAGQPGDRCDTLGVEPSCTGEYRQKVGECEFVGATGLPKGMVCHCPEVARAITWNHLGTPLPEGDSAWFDMRDRLVGLHGRVPLPPEQREGCTVSAYGPGTVAMKGTTDSEGRFSLTGLVPGSYQVIVRCSGWKQVHTVSITDGLAVVPLKVE